MQIISAYRIIPSAVLSETMT